MMLTYTAPASSPLSSKAFAVLNSIYLKKMATASVVADITGIPLADVETQLDQALQHGQAMALPDGVILLPEGIAAVLAYYHTAYENIRLEPSVVQWYAAFEILNRQLIAAVSAWQHMPGDGRAERKLIQCVDRLIRNLAQLTPKVPRYDGYVRRFESALDLIVQGALDYVCNPALDCVHNIWFEFHEDILALLGRPRDST